MALIILGTCGPEAAQAEVWSDVGFGLVIGAPAGVVGGAIAGIYFSFAKD